MPTFLSASQGHYQGTVAAKLARARLLFSAWGEDFSRTLAHISLLASIRGDAEDLGGHMVAMDMGRLCGACGAKPGGGYCSLEMGEQVDSILLLTNLLHGVDVRIVRDDGFECGFRGLAAVSSPSNPISVSTTTVPG